MHIEMILKIKCFEFIPTLYKPVQCSAVQCSAPVKDWIFNNIVEEVYNKHVKHCLYSIDWTILKSWFSPGYIFSLFQLCVELCKSQPAGGPLWDTVGRTWDGISLASALVPGKVKSIFNCLFRDDLPDQIVCFFNIVQRGWWVGGWSVGQIWF